MERPSDEVTGPGALREREDDTGPIEMTDDTSERVEELKGEISQARGELRETIAEIQERLTPSHLAEQARTAVRDATIGRVSHMAERAGETASDLTEQARRVARRLPAPVRDNPMPMLLIGAGVAWLIGSRVADRNGRGRWDREDYDSGEYRGDRGHSRHDVGSQVGERSDWSSAEYSSGPQVPARERVTRAGEQVQSRIARSMRENPLAYGVAAVAAGAVMGTLMPRTDVEDEYLGEARDTVVESARDMAEDAVHKISSSGESPSGAGGGAGSIG
jgi:ElaB/YqjD/DUF883 family membrane-anchored ribosome-binding protein